MYRLFCPIKSSILFDSFICFTFLPVQAVIIINFLLHVSLFDCISWTQTNIALHRHYYTARLRSQNLLQNILGDLVAPAPHQPNTIPHIMRSSWYSSPSMYYAIMMSVKNVFLEKYCHVRRIWNLHYYFYLLKCFYF